MDRDNNIVVLADQKHRKHCFRVLHKPIQLSHVLHLCQGSEMRKW